MLEMNPARSKFEKQLAKEKTQAEKSLAKLKRPCSHVRQMQEKRRIRCT